MSYLDGGAGERIPTAQTFLPPHPANAPETPGTPPQGEEGPQAIPEPPRNFPAWLKAVATQAWNEAKRYDILSKHKEPWAIAAALLSSDCLMMMEALRILAAKIENAPFPLRPNGPRKGA